MPSALDVVLGYHEETKHHPMRYARALGYLDWDTQPDPFRTFAGAQRLELALVPPGPAPSLAAVLDGEAGPAARLDRAAVSQLLFDSLALSAWKEHGAARWSLRVNPSSGNLHPTEGYLVAGAIDGLTAAPAVLHYAPLAHALEVRRELTAAQWSALAQRLPPGAALFALTSIHWREAWKYGERAFRYCQHDAGHAIGAVALAAAALGWEARLLEACSEPDLAVVLGLHVQHGIEAEHADGLIALAPRGAAAASSWPRDVGWPRELVDALARTAPLGAANRLSSDHHEWPIIDEVATATVRKDAPPASCFAPAPARAPLGASHFAVPARPLFHVRRSAVALDGRTSITRKSFVEMLRAVRPGGVPFDALPWRPRIHLGLFVHRVEDVAPGLYCMVRDPGARARLRGAMRRDFVWDPVEGVPDDLGLALLVPLDCRSAARTISCHQDIAADGAFALGMLADYRRSLDELGPWFYRRLHWEAGLLGQVLYLEAEAAGVRATGIGCFFDDLMHQALGLAGDEFQTLYHFTLGGPVDDPRLRTLGAYDHLGEPPRPAPPRIE